MDWANSWNSHRMTIPGHGTRSPADLRWFSMLQDGARGFSPLNPTEFEPVEDILEENEIDEYGIDWETYQDARFQEHHSAANPTETFPENPFITHRPESLCTGMIQVIGQLPLRRRWHRHKQLMPLPCLWQWQLQVGCFSVEKTRSL